MRQVTVCKERTYDSTTHSMQIEVTAFAFLNHPVFLMLSAGQQPTIHAHPLYLDILPKHL